MVSPPRGLDPAPPQEVYAQQTATRYAKPWNPVGVVYRPTSVPPHPAMLIDVDVPMGAFVPDASVNGTGVVGGTGGGGGLGPVLPPPPPPVRRAEPVSRPPERVSAPMRVSAGVQEAMIVRRVIPVYPPLARQARVSGTVRLMGVISRDGTIQQLQVLSGHPLLVSAAVEAVRQWVYRPTMLSGEPVEVQAPIEVHFTLAQ